MDTLQSTVNKEIVQNGSTVVKTKKTFAEVAKTNQQQPNLADIKNLLRSEKIEDQLEEQRKRSKQSNIIIHGVPESDDTDHTIPISLTSCLMIQVSITNKNCMCLVLDKPLNQIDQSKLYSRTSMRNAYLCKA